MRLHQGGPRKCLGRLAWVGLMGLLLSGCRVLTTASLRPLPFSERFGNPWGPEANARRESSNAGRCVSPRMAHWMQFAQTHLEEGDILFRRGCTSLIPALDVSRVLSGGTDSPFSHVGLVCRDEQRFWVYDIESTGVHKIPFESWMLDVYKDVFAVKRLREPYRDRIAQALAFCEKAYQMQVPFDYTLKLSDDALYCSEMVEKAFRSAGLSLCDPVPLCCLPRYRRYRCLGAVLQKLTSMRMDEPVFVPGNASYGLYASPLLETVYESPEATSPRRSQNRPPRCTATLQESQPN